MKKYFKKLLIVLVVVSACVTILHTNSAMADNSTSTITNSTTVITPYVIDPPFPPKQ